MSAKDLARPITVGFGAPGLTFGVGDDQDREGEHDGCEPDADEPSLCGITVSPLGMFGDQDLEDDEDSGIGDRDGLLEQTKRML